MPRQPFNALRKASLFLMPIVFALVSSSSSYAIPAFSRMYGTSCSTCHIDFPKLNDFGKAFKDAGFKFPKDDESMLKIPPVMLGAPANAELWPKAIWPGTIPGIPPIGLRMNNYFQYTGTSSGKFASLTPAGTLPPFVPTTDFETGLFSIFTAGNFGSDIAFWVDDDISVAGANGNGGLGDGYLKFVNIGRLIKLPKNSLNLRVGQFELELPFTQARSIWISPYDIYSQANIGAMNSLIPLQQFVNNQFTMADAGKGIELSGGLHTGGYQYSIAFIDQNTSGVSQDMNPGSPYVPQATGSNQGGLGVASDANFKDIYAQFQYRFNLERDKESRNAIQAAGPTGPRDHTYLNFGTYYFYGRSVQRLLSQTADGTQTVITAREPFYRVGGNMTFNYRCCLQFNALYMYGHDYNLLPIDSSGNLIPLQNSEHCRASGLHSQHPGHLQRRLCGCGVAGLSVDDGDDALRRRELDLRSHQWIGNQSFVYRRPLQRTLQVHAQPRYARRAVPDPRQHQGVVRVSVPAVADGGDRHQSADRLANGIQSVPHQHGRARLGICVLARTNVRDETSRKEYS